MLSAEASDHIKPATLNYAAGDTLAEESFRRQLFIAIVTLPALVVPFVSFTYDTTPAYAIKTILYEQLIEHYREQYHLLMVLAVGLSWPLLLWCWDARSLLPIRIRDVERIILIAMASLLAAAGLVFSFMGLFHDLRNGNTLTMYDALSFGSCPAILIAGGCWLVLMRQRLPRRKCAYLLNQLAYLSVAVMALLAFAERRDPGWWMTVYLCAIALIELIVSFFNPLALLRARAKVVPAAAIPVESKV